MVFVGCADNDADRDEVRQLRADLTNELALLTGEDAVPAVKLGWDLPPGASWRPELLRWCTTAQVYVPLLSPGFLGSRWCGREWAIFAARVARASGDATSVPPWMLVVNWVTPPRGIPRAVRQVQTVEWSLTEDKALERRYRLDGLYYLQKQHPKGYDELCWELAKKVVAAMTQPLIRLSVDEAGRLEPAFPVSSEMASTPAPRDSDERVPIPSDHGAARSEVSVRGDHAGANTQSPSADPALPPDWTPSPWVTTSSAVADILATISTLREAEPWRRFLRSIVVQRGRDIPSLASRRSPDREEALLDQLCRHHSAAQACGYVIRALDEVPGSAQQQAQIVAIRDRQNHEGTGGG